MRSRPASLLPVIAAVLAAAGPSSAQVRRVQPLGDSITMGAYDNQSYRYPLWTMLIDAGIAIDYVGTRTDNAGGTASYPNYRGRVFNRAHEGHAGWRAQDLVDGCTASDPCFTKDQGYLAQWLRYYTPDVALVHAGTNDILQGAPQSATLASLDTIIATLRADNPAVIILLAQITPLYGLERDIKIRALNAQIATLAASRSTAASPVYLVDQYSGFNVLTDTLDNVHPNPSGEYKMARKWFAALQEALVGNQPPQVNAGPDRVVHQYRDTLNLIGLAVDDGRPSPPGAVGYSWTQVAGPPAAIADPSAQVTPVTLSAPGDYTFRLAAGDGELTGTDAMTVRQLPYACPPLHRETGGRVIIEAEATRSRRPGTGIYSFTFWAETTDPPGFGGTAALSAQPAGIVEVNTFDGLSGGHADYWVEFTTPGRYYAWARMLAPGLATGSIHLGLDGVPATLGAQGMRAPPAAWTWVGETAAGRVVLDVPAPGLYRIDLWLRQEGTCVDKLLLDRDPLLLPQGVGPEASPVPRCDFDEDGMDDPWELARWGTLAVPGAGNNDGDAYLNVEEYVAGTDPEDAGSFPRAVGVRGTGLEVPSAAGRYYRLEYSNPAAGLADWRPAGPEVPGTGGLLTLPDPAPGPARAYRFRVRADGP